MTNSNTSQKFMTIPVQSDINMHELDTTARQDQFENGILQSISNFEQSKLSSINAVSDRIKVNSKGLVSTSHQYRRNKNQKQEQDQNSLKVRSRQAILGRVNSYNQLSSSAQNPYHPTDLPGDQVIVMQSGLDERVQDGEPQIPKPLTSEEPTRGKNRSKGVMIKTIINSKNKHNLVKRMS